MIRSHLSKPILYILLLMITALIYGPGLSGSFLFDDFPNIVNNLAVHAESITLDTLQRAARALGSGTLGRPLAAVSFAIDYSFGGKNPWGYKLVNLLVHLLNVLLIFTLTQRLLALPRVGMPRNTTVAFTIAVLWAVHPLQISTVLYIVQRMETLALTFVLLALLAYLHSRARQREGARGWPWLATSVLLAGIGLLSKETAALFPAYTLALELTVLVFEARSSRTTRCLQWAYGAGIALALALFFFWILPHYNDPAAYSGRAFTLGERLLSQLRVLPMYLGWMLLPLPNNMTFYYDNYPFSQGWLDPVTTLIGGLFLLGLIATAWLVRRRMPLLALGIFWFFAAHILSSNVIPVELVFEHRNYFALFGVLLALTDLIRRIPFDKPILKKIAVATIAIGFSLLACLRAAVWGNPLLLSMDLVAKNPFSPRASYYMALAYVDISGSNPNSPLFSMAEQELERGSRLPNAPPSLEQGLILIAAATDQPIKDEWWERLIEKLKTRPIGSSELLTVIDLVKQRQEGIKLSDQRIAQAYTTLLARGPREPIFYVQYGDFVLRYLNDPQLASQLFVQAVERNPSDVAYALQIAQVLLGDGHAEQALAVIDKTQALGIADPDNEFAALSKQALIQREQINTPSP